MQKMTPRSGRSCAHWLLFGLLAPSATAQITVETVQIFPEDGEDGDSFGVSVAMSGFTVVIGADKDDDNGTDAGAAYVYEVSLASNEPFGAGAKLLATGPSRHFGESVGVSGDTIVVGGGGPNLDAGFVFERDPCAATGWSQGSRLVSVPNTRFGEVVGISGDTVVVGAPGEQTVTESGVAYVFERDHGGLGLWGMSARLVASDAATAGVVFGEGVSIFGDTIAVADRLAGLSFGQPSGYGAIYVFERDNGGPNAWGEVARIEHMPGEDLGPRVAIWQDRLVAFATTTLHAYARHLGGPNAWGLESSKLFVGQGPLAFSEDTLLTASSFASGTVDMRNRNLGGLNNWGIAKTLGPSSPTEVTGFPRSCAVAGEQMVVGALDGQGLPDVEALASDPNTGLLYAYSRTEKSLATIDLSSGLATRVGVTGVSKVSALAFDPASSSLYAARWGIAPGDLYRLDKTTGVAMHVGEVGFQQIRGLAFDSISGTLYGTEVRFDQLITIDTTTGAGTAVGALGFDNVEGLAFDGGTGFLYGTTEDGELIRIDPSTGAGSLVGNLAGEPVGLTFDVGAATLYGVERDLFAIDPTNGAEIEVGPTFIGSGSAFLYGVGVTSSYCTPGTSTNGCRATVSSRGIASRTSATGFDVLVSGVETMKTGLIYFGTTGPKTAPWGMGTSYQCVRGPHVRTPTQTSGGDHGPSCDGTFSLDFNAWMASNPTRAPAAGETAWMQAWFRDPPAPKTTAFSDALVFQVCP